MIKVIINSYEAVKVIFIFRKYTEIYYVYMAYLNYIIKIQCCKWIKDITNLKKNYEIIYQYMYIVKKLMTESGGG